MCQPALCQPQPATWPRTSIGANPSLMHGVCGTRRDDGLASSRVEDSSHSESTCIRDRERRRDAATMSAAAST